MTKKITQAEMKRRIFGTKKTQGPKKGQHLCVLTKDGPKDLGREKPATKPDIKKTEVNVIIPVEWIDRIDMTEPCIRETPYQNALNTVFRLGVIELIKDGRKEVEHLLSLNPPHRARIDGTGITYAEIMQGVIDGRWNLHDYKAYPTGQAASPKGETEPYTTYTLVSTEPTPFPGSEISEVSPKHPQYASLCEYAKRIRQACEKLLEVLK